MANRHPAREQRRRGDSGLIGEETRRALEVRHGTAVPFGAASPLSMAAGLHLLPDPLPFRTAKAPLRTTPSRIEGDRQHASHPAARGRDPRLLSLAGSCRGREPAGGRCAGRPEACTPVELHLAGAAVLPHWTDLDTGPAAMSASADCRQALALQPPRPLAPDSCWRESLFRLPGKRRRPIRPQLEG